MSVQSLKMEYGIYIYNPDNIKVTQATQFEDRGRESKNANRLLF